MRKRNKQVLAIAQKYRFQKNRESNYIKEENCFNGCKQFLVHHVKKEGKGLTNI